MMSNICDVYAEKILFNKAVLDQMDFPYPMFLTTWHMFLAMILTQVMSKTTNMLPGVKEVSEEIDQCSWI
jgi:hypothetical protein